MSQIACTYPHEVYAAFIHGISNKWSYLSQTIPNTSHLLTPLVTAIHQKFVPALRGHPPCSETDRIFSHYLPCFGGLRITNPTEESQLACEALTTITAPLVALIVTQDIDGHADCSKVTEAKSHVRSFKKTRYLKKANDVREILNPPQQRLFDLSCEKGCFTWLSALPISEYGFNLHKVAFRDAFSLCYGWQPSNMPLSCNCGSKFTVGHAMTCHMGGYPTIRHNEIHDPTADLLTEVCHNVICEPTPFSLSLTVSPLNSPQR